MHLLNGNVNERERHRCTKKMSISMTLLILAMHESTFKQIVNVFFATLPERMSILKERMIGTPVGRNGHVSSGSNNSNRDIHNSNSSKGCGDRGNKLHDQKPIMSGTLIQTTRKYQLNFFLGIVYKLTKVLSLLTVTLCLVFDEGQPQVRFLLLLESR
jgi:hypothetical protein